MGRKKAAPEEPKESPYKIEDVLSPSGRADWLKYHPVEGFPNPMSKAAKDAAEFKRLKAIREREAAEEAARQVAAKEADRVAQAEAQQARALLVEQRGKVDAPKRISEYVSFFPKQLQALLAMRDYRFILYGGARGGGKSYWLRWALLSFVIEQYARSGIRGVTAGLFCETYPDLRDRQISKIKAEFPRELGDIHETKADGLAFFVSDAYGGGRISLRNLDDPSRYQSAEFAAIGVDELTKTVKPTFDFLRGSLRWPGVSHTVFLGATNPGGVGHGWVKQYWIDRDFPPEMMKLAEEFKFIQALPADNPKLDQVYWDDLNSLPEDLRRAWVEGNWDVFAGQAFTSWNRDRHVCKPFEIPDWWPRMRGIDWGYAAPFCCLWGARNPDNGRVYVYREVYASGLTDQQQARLVRDLTPMRETNVMTFADPSMWVQRTSGGLVTSTADEYASEGVPLMRADNDRANGKRKVDRLLMAMQDGEPGIKIFEGCTNLIRTLPELPYDKYRVEDIDTKAEDHAYDALRYLLSGSAVQAPKSDSEPRRARSGYPLANSGLL